MNKQILAIIAILGTFAAVICTLIFVAIPAFHKSNTSPSYVKCNALDNFALSRLDALFAGQTVDGKAYQCRQWVGDPPVRTTSITYTLRNSADQSGDTQTIIKQVARTLQDTNWTITSLHGATQLEAKREKGFGLTYRVLREKPIIAQLTIGVAESTQLEGNDSTKVANKPLPDDYFVTYSNFPVYLPAAAPSGYSAWKLNSTDYNVSFSSKKDANNYIDLTESAYTAGTPITKICPSCVHYKTLGHGVDVYKIATSGHYKGSTIDDYYAIINNTTVAHLNITTTDPASNDQLVGLLALH